MTQPETPPRGDTATLVTILAITSLTIMAGATIAPSLPGIRDHFVGTPDVELLTRLLEYAYWGTEPTPEDLLRQARTLADGVPEEERWTRDL